MKDNVFLQFLAIFFGALALLVGKIWKDHEKAERERLLSTVCSSRRYTYELRKESEKRGESTADYTRVLLAFTIMREVLDPGGKRRRGL